MNERVKFVAAMLEGEESFGELCERFGISMKQGYEWRERYEAWRRLRRTRAGRRLVSPELIAASRVHTSDVLHCLSARPSRGRSMSNR